MSAETALMHAASAPNAAILLHGAHADPASTLAFAARVGRPVTGHLPTCAGVLGVGGSEQAWNDAVAATATGPTEPLTAGRIGLVAPDPPRVVATGSSTTVTVELSNLGRETLRSTAPFPVHCSYHWRDDAGGVVVFEGARTSLPFGVEPGDRVTLGVQVDAPRTAGAHHLVVTAVQEGIAWFDGVDPANAVVCAVTVEGPPA